MDDTTNIKHNLTKFKINKINPDWQIEKFLVNFKDQFINFLTMKKNYMLIKISSHLNDLQRNKKYEQIQQYIVSHFDKIRSYNFYEIKKKL